MFETGVGIRNPLFFIGVVEEIDKRNEGRVRVRAFGVHGTVQQIPTENLPWAIPISGSYDPNVPVPRINTWVFGFFLDGRDAQQPMLLGSIPTQMTEIIDPVSNGWGVIPTKDGNLLAQGSAPSDFGQPSRSRLARGENIEETYVLAQEMGRVKNITSAGLENTWDEPVSAYNAQYPYNRVIETASHSIELDDTPGAERIMIQHKSGSYVQIDTNGTTTHKATSDKYDINETNHHVYIGGRSMVTIEGDSHVLVKGNKVEEVAGNYIQLVHGNHMLSVAGQSTLNISDEIQIRAANVKLEANIGNVSVKGVKSVKLEATGGPLYMKSGADIFSESAGVQNIKGSELKLGAAGTSSLSGATVYIDNIVRLSEGGSAPPDPSIGADSIIAPPPTPKSVVTTAYRNTSSVGTAGYISTDDVPRMSSALLSESVTEGTLKPLLDLIAKRESGGDYNAYNKGTIGNRILPATLSINLTILTLEELQRRGRLPTGNPDRIFAAGRYQIIPTTRAAYAPAAGLQPSDLYSAQNQDLIAIQLLIYRGLNSYLAGSITRERFANNLAQEWAALPVVDGPKAGLSYYSNIGGNKAGISVNEIISVLTELKAATEFSS